MLTQPIIYRACDLRLPKISNDFYFHFTDISIPLDPQRIILEHRNRFIMDILSARFLYERTGQCYTL